jgi:hypothetical protein
MRVDLCQAQEQELPDARMLPSHLQRQEQSIRGAADVPDHGKVPEQAVVKAYGQGREHA